MKLVLFAEKYCIDVLADYAMDITLLATQEWEERDFTQPSLKVIQLFHDNTLPNSGLRLYLAKCPAICYVCCKWSLPEKEKHNYIMSGNTGNIHELLSEYMTDMFDHLQTTRTMRHICA
jgi:hypothetical protein